MRRGSAISPFCSEPAGRRFPVGELIARTHASLIARDGDPERARKAVTNRIRQAIARIAAANGGLGLHLRNAVHTGALCSYTPDRMWSWKGARVASLRET